MNTSSLPSLVALLLALTLAAPQALAHCWAGSVAEPHTNDGLRVDHPSLRPLHAAMDRFEAQARPNAGLLALPDVRLRLRRHVMDSDDASRRPREAVIHAHGYGPKTWVGNDCEIHPQAAERIGPRAGFSVFINSPLVTMNRWAHDEQLSAYLEGERGEPMQGWPVYRDCAVIAPERRLPRRGRRRPAAEAPRQAGPRVPLGRPQPDPHPAADSLCQHPPEQPGLRAAHARSRRRAGPGRPGRIAELNTMPYTVPTPRAPGVPPAHSQAAPPRPPGLRTDRPQPCPGFRSLDPSSCLGAPQGAAFSLGG